MLSDAFAARLGEAAAAGDARERLEARLCAAVTAARAAHPGVELDADRFAAFVAEKVPADTELITGLDALRLDALWLTRAAIDGDARALATLDAMVGGLAAPLVRFRRGPTFVDDIQQLVRERLLTGASPRLLEYGGRGELGAWLRAIALRIAIDRTRTPDRLVQDEDALAEHAAGGSDPELTHMKERYGTAFRDALREAIRALDPAARNTLRLYYLDSLTLEELGRLLDVVPSTVWRRLAAARRHVLEWTRNELRVRLAVGEPELESVLRLVESRFELPASAFEEPGEGAP